MDQEIFLDAIERVKFDLPVDDTQWQIGARVLAGEDVGALFFTPQNLLDFLNLQKTRADALNRDVQESTARPKLKEAWRSFYEAWNKFYEANATGAGGWYQRGWSSTKDAAHQYAAQMDQWLAAFKREGGTSVVQPMPLDTNGGVNWGGVALVGIGALLAFLVLR